MTAAVQTSLFDNGFGQVESFDTSFLDVPLLQKVRMCREVIKSKLREGYHLCLSTSMGKDSSVMTSIALDAMVEMKAAGEDIPSFVVVMSNTGIENPIIDIYSRNEAAKVSRFIKQHSLPGRMDIITPSLSNNYLVRLIGGSTIASLSDNDAKCSVMLKVEPIKRHKKRIFKAFGKKAKILSLVGKRWDESDERMRNMIARGENNLTPVKDSMGCLILSPIAHFTQDDVWSYIGQVVNGKLKTYSDFVDLMEVYRSGEGECAVIAYMDGRPRGTACGARFGCHLCCRVSNDASLVNMLKEERYSFMKPLNQLRQYILDNHYNPQNRNWLARRVLEDGTVTISPNAYSPDFCEQLLKICLTIDAREREAAYQLGIQPRFQLLNKKEIIGIDCYWNRHGYQQGLHATYLYERAHTCGERWDIPETEVVYKELPAYQPSRVPFADSSYMSVLSGFRDAELAIMDQESLVEKGNGQLYTDANTAEEFQIDGEGVEMFFAFEVDYALEKYHRGNLVSPTAALNYLVRLGFVQLQKGQHSELDRMIRMANQIWRLDIRDCLNNPTELIRRLGGSSDGQQELDLPIATHSCH